MAAHTLMHRNAATTWSFTRRRTLDACARQFFWQYLGSRGGAYAPEGSPARLAWTLRQTTSLPLLIGTVVHNAARQLIVATRDGAPLPTLDELLDGARATLNHVWVTSERLLDRFWRLPAVYPAFREVVNRGSLAEYEIERARRRLARTMANLYAAPVFADLARCGPREVTLTEAIADEFLLTAASEPDERLSRDEAANDVRVLVALDLAYVHHDPETAGGPIARPTWTVADFKTGARGQAGARDDVRERLQVADERLQLAGYALGLRARGVPMQDGAYLGRVIHLDDGTQTFHRLTERDLAWAMETIDGDARRLRVLEAQGSARGITTDAIRAAFSMAERPYRACPKCAFLSICSAELGRRPWQRPRVPDERDTRSETLLPGLPTPRAAEPIRPEAVRATTTDTPGDLAL